MPHADKDAKGKSTKLKPLRRPIQKKMAGPKYMKMRDAKPRRMKSR